MVGASTSTHANAMQAISACLLRTIPHIHQCTADCNSIPNALRRVACIIYITFRRTIPCMWCGSSRLTLAFGKPHRCEKPGGCGCRCPCPPPPDLAESLHARSQDADFQKQMQGWKNNCRRKPSGRHYARQQQQCALHAFAADHQEGRSEEVKTSGGLAVGLTIAARVARPPKKPYFNLLRVLWPVVLRLG